MYSGKNKIGDRSKLINAAVLKSYLERIPETIRVVSFDIFDTILIRLLPSEKVKRIAAEKYCKQLAEETSVILPPSVYLKSWSDFKLQMDKKGLFADAEWTLSEWLRKFSKQCGLDTELALRIGFESELEAEFMSLSLSKNIPDLMFSIQKKGLKLIAVSDMWLDQCLLTELLKKFGLTFDAVFTSGTMEASKRRGTIFQKIEKRMELAPKSFIHVGDNIKADFIRPRLAGWKSLWMPHSGNTFQTRLTVLSNRNGQNQNSWKEIIKLMRSSEEVYTSDPLFNMGFNHLAPLLILFSIVQWRMFRNQHIDIVFYVARDAKAMFDIYEAIENFLPYSCPRRYIRLSRKVMAITHPDNLLQNATHLAGKLGKKKVSEWLSNFTISEKIRRDILLHAGVKESDNFTPFVQKCLRFACNELLPLITKEQDIHKAIVRDYLRQEAGETSLRRLGIVDSGWACTIQDSIRSVLSDSELISGMYFGVSAQGHKPNVRNLKYGLLRDDFRKCRHHNPLESSAGVVRMWDTILREPTGTVTKLHRKRDNTIVPILSNQVIIGAKETDAAESIKRGIYDGTSERIKSISLLVNLAEQTTDTDFETAATMISRNISTRPLIDAAKAIIRLAFDEGVINGGKGYLGGFAEVKNGVAWYPGILSTMGLAWLSPILEAGARPILMQKVR